MANNSSASISPVVYLFTITGSVDNLISIPVNIWALWLIVSGNKALLGAELLTLNLMSMEAVFSLCFFLTLVQVYFLPWFLDPMMDFYFGASVVGRAVFQCHICVDRYLAVIRPVFFIRYKQNRYREACLVVLWLLVLFTGLTGHLSTTDRDLLSITAGLLLVPILCIEYFCSTSILKILRKPGPGDNEGNQRKEANMQKMRAIKIISLSHTLLGLNVLPLVVVPLFVPSDDKVPVVFTFSNVGSSAQAFLFLSRVGKLPCKG